MTLPQIEHEFHGSSDRGLTARENAEAQRIRIKNIFDAVCIRYKLNGTRLLLVPPKELVRMVMSVDEKFRKTGVDETATSTAARTYVQNLNKS